MFIRGPNPIWFMNNLTGQPLNDTYYAFFLTNTLPYIPQAVFQDPNGTNPWSDRIEFQPSAGLPNNLYFDPTLVYRIEIRQGPDQTFPLIWLIENYTLSSEAESGGVIGLTTAKNMITNPQFADIYFVSPLTINVAGTYDIGPGWKLITTGTGSTVITQVPNDGNEHEQGNPPYYLTFQNSGWSTVQLQQRFTNNGAIFGGGAAACAITGNATGSAQTISVVYAPSTGGATTLLTQILPVGPLLPFSGAIDIPASSNTDSGEDAYVNINIVLPTNGTVSITNIQITGQSVPLPSGYLQTQNPLFQEITYERVVDQEFHVYKDSLLTQPKDNLLVGWTFALNPWQFQTTTITNISGNQYTADQTILVQQAYVNGATMNNVAVGQGTNAENFAYIVKAVTAHNNFSIIQYIDPATIAPYWGQVLSVMVNLALSTSHSTSVRFKIRLIYKAGLPSTISQTDPVSSWTEGSDPTFAAGWTALKPLNDPVYTIDTINQNFSFDQFKLPASSSDNMTLGIVIYTIDNMNQNATADQILFNRVSLVPNDFAIDANPETWDETFRKCQYYYEKSYQDSDAAGTVTNIGLRLIQNPLNANGGTRIAITSFQFPFIQVKRATPTMKFYSSDGTADNVRMQVKTGGSGSFPVDQNVPISNWTFTLSNSSLFADVNSNVESSSISGNELNQGRLLYHYTCDARLGV